MAGEAKQTAPLGPAPFCMVRTPLLTTSAFFDWMHQAATAASSQEKNRLDAADLRHHLRAVFLRPEVKEALFIASPSLSRACEQWLASGREAPLDESIESALVKYYSRMSLRPTPFGLFAGVGVGHVSSTATRFVMGRAASFRRHTRLDMGYILGLIRYLESIDSIRDHLSFRLNSSAYRCAGTLRFAEGIDSPDGRTYQLTSLQLDEPLDLIVTAAHSGATLQDLARGLAARFGHFDEAKQFVDALVSCQLLVSNLQVSVAGDEPIPRLLSALTELGPDATKIAGQLQRVAALMTELDRAGCGQPIERYTEIADALERVGPVPDRDRVFQVDMVAKPAIAEVGRPIIDELLAAVHTLHRATPIYRNQDLDEFIGRFLSRYELREVPLAEALDDDFGIGFPPADPSAGRIAPLVRGLPFGQPRQFARGPWDQRDHWLAGKLKAVKDADEVHVSLREIEALGIDIPSRLPQSFTALVRISSVSQRALDQGDFRILLQSMWGPSAAMALGRFCHADTDLLKAVRQLTRREQQDVPGVLLAEVAHLPEGRDGNVVLRPVLRQYEIPYMSAPSTDKERQIPLRDLYVSVRNGRVVLRSAHFDREVLPRMATALSVRRGLPLYRFLHAIQFQDTTGSIEWNWGGFITHRFLPRVVIGRTVVSLATWRPTGEEHLFLTKGPEQDVMDRIARWRDERHIPRFVALNDSDNVLPIDLENVLSVKAFIGLIRHRHQDRIKLTEVWPGPHLSAFETVDGEQVQCEIAIPLVTNVAPGTTVSLRKTASSSTTRTFVPGAEWVYAKLYAGPSLIDSLLTHHIVPLVRQLSNEGQLREWFFVRYGDPDWHLRIRLRAANRAAVTAVQAAIQQRMAEVLTTGQCWRAQFDTYVREVERYGGDYGIELVERLFTCHSVAAAEILEVLAEHSNEPDARWLVTLSAMHALLEDLGIPLKERLDRLNRARDAAMTRLTTQRRAMAESLGAQFRSAKVRVEQALSGRSEDSILSRCTAIMNSHRAEQRDICEALAREDAQGRLTVPAADIGMSLIHMLANRLLRDTHQRQEMVLHDYLGRYYRGQTARRDDRRQAAAASII